MKISGGQSHAVDYNRDRGIKRYYRNSHAYQKVNKWDEIGEINIKHSKKLDYNSVHLNVV
jgi:hypothetical protein